MDGSMIGEVIRRLRAERDLSQAQLAGLSGVAQQTISSVETGKNEPGAHTMMELAAAFGMTPDDLYRQAGLLPANEVRENGLPYVDGEIQKLLALALGMSSESRRLLVAIAEQIILVFGCGRDGTEQEMDSF